MDVFTAVVKLTCGREARTAVRLDRNQPHPLTCRHLKVIPGRKSGENGKPVQFRRCPRNGSRVKSHQRSHCPT